MPIIKMMVMLIRSILAEKVLLQWIQISLIVPERALLCSYPCLRVFSCVSRVLSTSLLHRGVCSERRTGTLRPLFWWSVSRRSTLALSTEQKLPPPPQGECRFHRQQMMWKEWLGPNSWPCWRPTDSHLNECLAPAWLHGPLLQPLLCWFVGWRCHELLRGYQ